MKVLFEFSKDPFLSDHSTQLSRMALSISVENEVTMVYRGDGAILSLKSFDVPVQETDFFNQERFLIEQEVKMYVLSGKNNINVEDKKPEVSVIDSRELDDIYRNQDVIFRN